ncbi:MAG TPA: hypothetical protein VFX70_07670, partial [Mycobacteriales bacterium]|nr:hypothetical protein [Mycobacteriales bacterium]
MRGTQAVQRDRLELRLAQLPADRQAAPEVVDGLLMLVEVQVDVAEVGQDHTLPPAVADLAAGGQAPFQVFDGLGEPPLGPVDDAQPVQRVRL